MIVKDLIGHFSSLMKTPGDLAPNNAVVMYHMIHILNILCLNSHKFKTFFRTELMDEIRYVMHVIYAVFIQTHLTGTSFDFQHLNTNCLLDTR